MFRRVYCLCVHTVKRYTFCYYDSLDIKTGLLLRTSFPNPNHHYNRNWISPLRPDSFLRAIDVDAEDGWPY